MATEVAYLAGGCFWCLEAAYLQLEGVEAVTSGYMGGTVDDPTYQAVCTGRTGHAETVRIEFDPAKITYEELLEVFFTVHDPTTLNRQGNDVGTQYRSAIFYVDDAQHETARQVIDRFTREGLWPGKIVTQVAPASKFYAAEKYHQNYFENNPNQPYCMFVVEPKVAKIRAKFASRLKQAS